MEYIPNIKEIYIVDFQYNFDNYILDFNSIHNSPNFFHQDERSKRYIQKIEILLSGENEKIRILRGLLFNEIKNWELYRTFAILEYYKPELCYIFYKVGEKYGLSDDTIVKSENKIIKNIFIYHNNQNVKINTFIDEQLKILNNSELTKIVNIYFNKRVENLDTTPINSINELKNTNTSSIEKRKFWTKKDYDRERGINVDAWDYGDNFNQMLECSREEEREAKRDTYNDGGGGQKWSDHSDIN